MKKIILAICIISALTMIGCSSTKEDQVRLRPDGTQMSSYQVYENEVKDGIFYVQHKDSICEPVYFGEATFNQGTVSSQMNNKRVLWFKKDYERIPTLYKGESLIYYTQGILDEKFTYERFEDYGYSIGIIGLKATKSGRYQISTDVDSNCTYPGSDADEILNLTNNYVIIDSIGDIPIRVQDKDSSNEETVTRFGSIGHLTKDKKYNVKVFEGTVEHDYVLTADVRMMCSMEGEVTADYAFSDENKIILTIPSNFNSGYYLINGVGIFRYIDGTNFDEDSTDMNRPNTDDSTSLDTEQSNGLVKETKNEDDMDSINEFEESTEEETDEIKIPKEDESFDAFVEEGIIADGNKDDETKIADTSQYSKIISKFNITSAGPIGIYITFEDKNGKHIENATSKIQAVISDTEGNTYPLFVEDEKTLTIEFESIDVGVYVIHYIGLEDEVPKVQVTTK